MPQVPVIHLEQEGLTYRHWQVWGNAIVRTERSWRHMDTQIPRADVVISFAHQLQGTGARILGEVSGGLWSRK